MKKANLLAVMVISISLLFLFNCNKEANPLQFSETSSNSQLSSQSIDGELVGCIPPPSYSCVRTPGYWKNHPEAWPVEEIEIGGVIYSKADAIEAMDQPIKKDKTYTFFKAVVAYKLNILNGSDPSCIGGWITSADIWFMDHPLGSDVRANYQKWTGYGEFMYLMFDDYNNGLLCETAPACP